MKPQGSRHTMLTTHFARHVPKAKQAAESKSFTSSSFTMKTKITLLAAIFGWAVTSHAHDPYRHADEDAHHAYYDRIAADAAEDHAREAYEHAIHAAQHGDYYHAARDFAHAAEDARAARDARDHADAAANHAEEAYCEAHHGHHHHHH